MGFMKQITQITAPLAQQREADVQAAHTLALRAPSLLRRFAEIAAAVNAWEAPFQEGHIFARRNKATGYHTVEYITEGLDITFHVVDDHACLDWHTAGEGGRLIVTPATSDNEIDVALYDAISALVNAPRAVTLANVGG